MGCLVAGAALLAATGHSQERRLGPSRVMVQDSGLAGIDRGLRANELPIDPAVRAKRPSRMPAQGGESGPRERAHLHRAGDREVSQRHGSKRPCDAGAVRGSTMQRPSYADFEILQVPSTPTPKSSPSSFVRSPTSNTPSRATAMAPMVRPNDPLHDRQWNFLPSTWSGDIQPEPAAGSPSPCSIPASPFRRGRCAMKLDRVLPFDTRRSNTRRPASWTCSVRRGAGAGEAKFVAPRDFIWEDNPPFDLDGHGTHVSGTIGQLTNNNLGVAGMAYNVRIIR